MIDTRGNALGPGLGNMDRQHKHSHSLIIHSVTIGATSSSTNHVVGLGTIQ